jgi:hypothetical protein
VREEKRGKKQKQNKTKKPTRSQAWWCRPVIPALKTLRQEDLKFQASLDYKLRL